MRNLNQLLKKPLQAVPNSFVIALLVVALLGFVDAAYLTIEHYQNVIPPCSLTGGCETVLTSAYSTIFGLPVALIGAVYYVLILMGIFSYLIEKKEKLLRFSLLFSAVGFLSSLWFLFAQAFILKAYCLYCLGSALSSIILFVISLVVLSKYRSQEITL